MIHHALPPRRFSISHRDASQATGTDAVSDATVPSTHAADVRSVSTLEALLKAVADGWGSAVVTIDIKKKGLGDEGAGKVAGA